MQCRSSERETERNKRFKGFNDNDRPRVKRALTGQQRSEGPEEKAKTFRAGNGPLSLRERSQTPAKNVNAIVRKIPQVVLRIRFWSQLRGPGRPLPRQSTVIAALAPPVVSCH
jgi:hypothetical protein